MPGSATSSISAPEPVPLLLRDVIHERTGLFFEADRLGSMLEKLATRASARGCQSFLDYYYILRYEDPREEELRKVLDLFSVQETYFWREYDQIGALVGTLVPEWFRHTVRPLRIWSAACATGEEPYSIAIALQEAGWGAHPIEIRGSDASESALEKARTGLYRERSFRALPPELRAKYFQEAPGGYRLEERIKARVRLQWANLLVPSQIEELAQADVVFCRNVFIYFSPQTIARVVDVLNRRMPPGAHLFIGASESLLKLTDAFDLQEIDEAFVYRKVAPPA